MSFRIDWFDLLAVQGTLKSLLQDHNLKASIFWHSALGSEVKASASNPGDLGSIPGLGRSPGEGNGNHFSILAWRIPWTEKPGGLQSTGSQRVGHDWATSPSPSPLFMVELSHPYMTTGKTVALTTGTFVYKVVFLLFNMLSRFVTTFLPRSKCLLISWLQSPSTEILEPKGHSVQFSLVAQSCRTLCDPMNHSTHKPHPITKLIAEL